MKGLMLKVRGTCGEWNDGIFRTKDRKIVELFCDWYNHHLEGHEFMWIEKIEVQKDKIRRFKNNRSVSCYEDFIEYLKTNS